LTIIYIPIRPSRKERDEDDLKGFEKLGINHINLAFDFSSHANNFQKRLEYSKQIKDEIISLILA